MPLESITITNTSVANGRITASGTYQLGPGDIFAGVDLTFTNANGGGQTIGAGTTGPDGTDAGTFSGTSQQLPAGTYHVQATLLFGQPPNGEFGEPSNVVQVTV